MSLINAVAAGAPTKSGAERFADLKRRVAAAVKEHGPIHAGVAAIGVRIEARKGGVGAALAELVETSAVHKGGTKQHPIYSVGTAP